MGDSYHVFAGLPSHSICHAETESVEDGLAGQFREQPLGAHVVRGRDIERNPIARDNMDLGASSSQVADQPLHGLQHPGNGAASACRLASKVVVRRAGNSAPLSDKVNPLLPSLHKPAPEVRNASGKQGANRVRAGGVTEQRDRDLWASGAPVVPPVEADLLPSELEQGRRRGAY